MLIEQRIRLEDRLWDHLSKLSEVNQLNIDTIISEAVEQFIDTQK